ncbi:MAG: tRNA (guanosine(37)-N1)-methyltransferase TrmD [Syntrophales bacterium]|jgi:tRNA (guanine37-N1)-methyltransferase|nr:tRNA (guanosine(37)-N1)-methyltransferase TrmD [Syntrophales bacterium]MCK9528884.1 tRNA (guanosine(37)-N1)-methyltransferase TrmD [Syntrophales bacterium]MDX9922952.1 tRNA (guanosine(37)-N1)-methyltransferase TrmD [Syntrophales bacterium]
MRFDVLTLFPDMFRSPFDASLIRKAVDSGLIEIEVHDIRDYARGKHRVTDDAPFGGGGGMVLKVDPLDRALQNILPDRRGALVILLSPQGEVLTQEKVEELSRHERIVLICGHYEGVDERVSRFIADRELSIGDYVLSGGECAAMVVVDAVSRLVEGFTGNRESVLRDSHTTGLLEGPHYTRPRTYREWSVPDVLLSGHKKNIDDWRRREALRRTLERRPDLLEKASLTDEDRTILEAFRNELSE